MSKGIKQALTLGILCLLMVGAIIAYFLVPQGEDEENANVTENAIDVVSIEASAINQVDISGPEMESISLIKNGEEWILADLPKAPLDAQAVDAMLSSLAPLTATKELAMDGASLAEYGLESPQVTVKVLTTDGNSYELKIGETVPVTGGNYGVFGDRDKVYAFEDTVFEGFAVSKNSLIAKEEIASIEEDYLTSISVKNKGKESFRAEIVSDDKKVDAYTNWVITKPFEKPLAGSSTDDWNKLQGYFTSVELQELVEYNCKNMKEYGLNEPVGEVEVEYFELQEGYELPEATANPDGKITSNSTNKANVVPKDKQVSHSYTLVIGGNAPDGSYYVRLKDSKNVYTMDAEIVQSMLGVDAYTYMDRCVYSTLATDINGYDAVIGDKKISVTRKTEKGDDGKDKNVWTLNGTQVSDENEETFLTPYTKGYLLEFTSEAKDSVKPKSNEPIMKIVFHEANRDVTVTYLPYDGTNFYRVDKNGMDYFLVDKRSVDDMISAYEALLKLDQ
nr:DUF4340 domain-containing protein [Eubacterium sp.]